MNIVESDKKCIGCGACIDVCPVNALFLVKDEYGFYVPDIDNSKCINCGKCIKYCPTINAVLGKKEPIASYYGWNNDQSIKAESTSGGVFSAFANAVLNESGVVFGAKYSDDFRSVVMASSDECSIDELRKSKYCETRPEHFLKKIDTELKKERKVLLVGTPCQIAAARRLFNDNPNLLLVDFFCGGTITDKVLEDYVDYEEKKNKSKVISMNMRDKSVSWDKPSMSIVFENKKSKRERDIYNYYLFYYYTPNFKKEQCLTCPFVYHNAADITIGDYWGFRYNPSVKNDGKGMSVLCAHTEKGKNFITNNSELTIFELDKQRVEYALKEKKHTSKAIAERKKSLEEIKEKSFIEYAKAREFKCGKIGAFCRKLKRKVIKNG